MLWLENWIMRHVSAVFSSDENVSDDRRIPIHPPWILCDRMCYSLQTLWSQNITQTLQVHSALIPTIKTTWIWSNLLQSQPVWLLETRRCRSNQSNAESIERNWKQSNDCDSIVERNWISIEYYPGFAVRLSNVIESIEYYSKFQFDWFDSEELTETDRHAASFFQNINACGWMVQANSWRNCVILLLRKI